MIIVSALIGLNYFFLDEYGGGGEFYTLWSGARAFLFENTDPYSSYVPQQVQELVYQRAILPGEQPYILDIPFHLLLLFFPFALISDPLLACSIYTAMIEIALFGLVYLSIRLSDWRPHRLYVLIFILFGMLNYYSILAVLEGSTAILVGLAYAGMLFAFAAGYDELTGALIALSFYKWEIGAPFLILLLFRVLQLRRWNILAGIGMISFVLITLSILLYPGWLIPFLRAGYNNLQADFGVRPLNLFQQLWPEHGIQISAALTFLSVIILIYEWSQARNADAAHNYWTICLTLAITPLMGQRTELENFVVLTLPIGLVFSVVYKRWLKIRNVLVPALVLLIFVYPWILYFPVNPGYTEQTDQLLFIFLPISTMLGLYWIRWWTIHPPRVWADR